MPPRRTFTAAHWGVYEVEYDPRDTATGLRAFAADPDPSPIGLHMLDPDVDLIRVRRPAVRESWLAGGPGTARERRGKDRFVEVSWDEALDLAAAELDRVRTVHGNRSIYGGSYGWSSAGRFHHAQSQVHRFLNSIGGYVRHQDSYSLGAARVLFPHIVAPIDQIQRAHSDWSVLAEHCQLFVSFGGVPRKNGQINAGGATRHHVAQGLESLRNAGVRFINVTPTPSDLHLEGDVEWIPIRPNTDAALLLALCHTLVQNELHDREFLRRYTVGFDQLAATLAGKDARWAEDITGIPAERIERLAREMASARTTVSMAWSLQRSHHGEQPFWSLIALASLLGQIGLPGGGFGIYGPVNLMGSEFPNYPGPTLPQGVNAVDEFIPVARIADMLLHPGQTVPYNGREIVYPDIRLIYWAGGNPFHHHQDLNRLDRAWREPETIVVHEQFWTATAHRADIVFPATTTLERDDIGYGNREPYLIAMKRAREPIGEARDDYAIFAELARRLGSTDVFTEGRDVDEWLRHLYAVAAERSVHSGVVYPDYDEFWEQGVVKLSGENRDPVLLGRFREDPDRHPLDTPSGRIELYSKTIASFGYDDCPGHPTWIEPAEWLGSPLAARFPLHLLSDQPGDKLHSQLDHSPHARATKIRGRQPITLHVDDAAARGVAEGDVVRVYNDRGACLAAAHLTGAIHPGVVQLATGAWYDPDDSDPPLEKHGNPNAVTLDIGASRLSQGSVAQTCLVEIELFEGAPPPVTAHRLPRFGPAPGERIS